MLFDASFHLITSKLSEPSLKSQKDFYNKCPNQFDLKIVKGQSNTIYTNHPQSDEMLIGYIGGGLESLPKFQDEVIILRKSSCFSGFIHPSVNYVAQRSTETKRVVFIPKQPELFLSQLNELGY